MLVNFYMENNLSKDINKQQTTNNKLKTLNTVYNAFSKWTFLFSIYLY